MAGDKPVLELIIQRLDQLQKVVDGLEASNVSTVKFNKNMQTVKATISQTVAEMVRFKNSIAKLGLEKNSLNSVLRNTASGGFETAFSLAKNKGLQSRVKAQAANMAAETIKSYAAEIRKQAKALNIDGPLISLMGVRQKKPGSTLSEIGLQIQAQSARTQIAETKFAETRSKTAEKAMLLEHKALEGLKKAQQDLIELERIRRQDIMKTAAASRQAAAEATRAAGLALKPQAKAISPSQGINNRLADPNYIPSLFKIQAALLGNYLVMGQIFRLFSFGAGFVLEFDKALHDLAAVTDTTDTQMVGLTETLINVSKATKFTAVEVANAATIMGQAGFSADQIAESIKSVTLFATAVGSDLSQAADTVTSVISVFNLKMSDTEHISNVLTGAINKTKLTTDKLQQGLQFAGNAAAQSGATFEELVSVLGALSNAGIKSGSTLGTGLRQIIIELQDPSEKFRKQLDAVGLSAEDVNIKSKGLIGALQNLGSAGFGAENAFKAFEIRSAAAYLAIANNITVANQLERQLLLTNAATEANAKQMESLSNILAQFKSQLGVSIFKAFVPLVDVLKDTIKLTGTLLDKLSDLGPALGIIGSLLSGFGIAVGVEKLFKLIAGLKIISGVIKTLAGIKTVSSITGGASALVGISGLATSIAGLTKTQLALNVAMSLVANKFTVIGLALSGAILGYSLLKENVRGLKEELDKSKAATDTAQAALEKTDQSIESIDQNIDRLRDRYSELTKNSDSLRTETLSLQVQFSNLGLKIEKNVTDPVKALIDALKKLREETQLQRGLDLEKLLGAASATQIKQAELAQKHASGVRINSSTTNAGIRGFSSEQIFAADRAFNESGGISDRVGALKQKDFSKLTSQQQEEYISEANNLRVLISAVTVATQKEANKIRTTKGFVGKWASGLATLDKMLEGMIAVSAEIDAIQAGSYQQQIILSEQKRNILQSSNTYKDTADKIDRLKEAFVKEQNNLAEAETNDDKVAKETSLNNLQNLKTELLQIITDLTGKVSSKYLEDLKKGLAEAIGGDQKSPEVQAMVDELLVRGKQLESEMTGPLNAQSKKLADGSEKMTKRFLELMEKIDLALNRATTPIDNQIGKIDAQLAANKDPRSPLFGEYSDAEEEILRKEQKAAETAKLVLRKASLEQKIKSLGGEIGQRSRASAIISKNSTDSGETSDQFKETTQDLKRTNDLEQQLAATRRELNDVTNELDASTGKATLDHKSLSEQIRDTINDYIKQNAEQAKWSNDLRENIFKTLDVGKSAFKGFITEVVTGTQSLGDSWRGFMRAVLESMLDTTTSKLAGIGADIAGKFITSLLPTPAGVPVKKPPVPKNSGGFIHAAAGKFITTRDAVPILAQHGEYVLRESAVSAIGRDNLDTINALGNRKISQSAPARLERQADPAVTNVWIVKEGEKPQMGKNDILAVIGQDILSGGQTKKLIKAVSTGAV